MAANTIEKSWEDLIVGGQDCPIADIINVLKSSCTQHVVLESKTLVYELRISECKNRIFLNSKADLILFDEMIHVWKEKNGSQATLKNFVSSLKKDGCNDFAAQLVEYFKSKILLQSNDKESNVNENILQTQEQSRPLLKKNQAVSTTENNDINTTVSNFTGVQEFNSINPLDLKRRGNVDDEASKGTSTSFSGTPSNQDFHNYISQLTCIFTNQRFLVGLCLLLIIIFIFIISRLHKSKTQTIVYPSETYMLSTTEIQHTKYLESQSVEVHSFDDYNQKFRSAVIVRNISLRIIIENDEDWPADGLIEHANEIVHLVVEGPLNVVVIGEFLSDAEILEKAFLNLKNARCSGVEANRNNTLRHKKTLNSLKEMDLTGIGNCFSVFLNLAQHIYLPSLLELRIHSATIISDTTPLFESLISKLTSLVAFEVTLNISTSEIFVIPLNTKVLRRFTINLHSRSEPSPVFPVLGDNGVLCEYGSKLEELHSENWFLQLDKLFPCANLKVINISYNINNNHSFDNILTFVNSFQFLRKLNLTLKYESTLYCPEKGLAGLTEIDCSVEAYMILEVLSAI